MSPKLQALKDALAQFDRTPEFSCGYDAARKALLTAVNAAGYDAKRAAENWARYQVAVGEAAEQLAEDIEPAPESMELFG